jgi:hypothetical protein
MVDLTFTFPLLFLISLVIGVGGERHAPATLPPRQRGGTDLEGGWADCGEEKIQ